MVPPPLTIRCSQAYQEALAAAERIGDRAEAAVCAYNLGHAYIQLSALRDPNRAEGWYRRSLELRVEGDRLGRGRCAAQLGFVAMGRFDEVRDAGRPASELFVHLNEAVRRYREALELFPPDAVAELAITHNQLGFIYLAAVDLDRAVHHLRQAIYFFDAQGDQFNAAGTRVNIALNLLFAGRREDALEYANAALRGFEAFGDRAGDQIQKTRRLIEEIRG
jgi:tetratricopeptide (TPR) repeat protein